MLAQLDERELELFKEQFPEPPPVVETVSFGVMSPRSPMMTERNKQNLLKFDLAYEQIRQIITARDEEPIMEIGTVEG